MKCPNSSGRFIRWGAGTLSSHLQCTEIDQRRYLAVEAQRMGFGGMWEYLASVFDCSVKTTERGMKELHELPNDPAPGRVRRPGGGRKKK